MELLFFSALVFFHLPKFQKKEVTQPEGMILLKMVEVGGGNQDPPPPDPIPPGEGWTEFSPSSDTMVVYVSWSDGNDSTCQGYPYNHALIGSDPFMPEGNVIPCKTISQGKSVMAGLGNNKPNWFLLKKGDQWFIDNSDNGANRLTFRSGRENEPYLISSYGNPGDPRPLINADGVEGLHQNGSASHAALVGIHLYAYRADPHNPAFQNNDANAPGVFMIGPYSDILFEDCKIEFFTENFDLQGWESQPAENIRIRRSVVVDAWDTPGSHSQGMFMKYINGALIEENVFDHNGWNEDVAAGIGLYFNHNFYLTRFNSNINLYHNIIARGSEHGIALNSSGLVENNSLIRNTIGFFIRTTGATAQNNVVLEGIHNSEGDSQGPLIRGIGVYPEDPPAPVGQAVAIENIVANSAQVVSNMQAIRVSEGIEDLITVEDNIVYNWGNESDPGPFCDPSRDVGSYNVTLNGQDSTEEFLTQARLQSKYFWREEYTAQALNDYIREGFQIGNCP